MSSYKRFNVAELRQLCDERGLRHAGLKKARLVQILNDDDLENQNVSDSVTASDAEGSDAEVEQGDGANVADGGGGGSVDDAVTASSASEGNESEEITVLRLKLRLAEEERAARAEEWEREQQRIAMQPVNASHSAQSDISNDVKNLLPTMCDTDALSFFLSFEKVLGVNEVDETLWVKYLPSKLSPKALKVFARLNADESRDYNVVKKAVLTSFKLDAHYYLKQFHSLRRSGNATYKMHLTSLSETLRYFTDAKNITTFDGLFDTFLMEQFLASLPADVREFVIAKQPTNSKECAVYADLSFEVKRSGRDYTDANNQPRGANNLPNRTNEGKARGVTGNSEFQANSSKFQNARGGVQNRPETYPQNKQFSRDGGNGFGHKRPGACFFCHSENHKIGQCPKRALSNFKSESCPTCGKYHPNAFCGGKQSGVYRAVSHENVNTIAENVHQPFIFSAHVNGKVVSVIRDSGNFGPALVDRRLVSKQDIIPGKHVLLSGAFDNGEKRRIPLCRIRIKSAKFGDESEIETEAGVCDMPEDFQCNLGNAFYAQNPKLKDIITVDRGSTGDCLDTNESVTSGAPQGGSSLAVPAVQSADNNQRRDNGTQTMHAGATDFRD